MNFPYITQLQVHDCYAAKGLNIPLEPLKEFRHIILTGKNGSGKTTILNRIGFILNQIQEGKSKEQSIRYLQGVINANIKHPTRQLWEKQISDLKDVDIQFSENSFQIFSDEDSVPFIVSFFKAHRRVELDDVKTVTIEDDFIEKLRKKNNDDDFTKLFKQYLVNKKVYEAFDFMNNREDKINQNKLFFDNLIETLKSIFEDDGLELEFVQESFEFYIVLSNKRKITFNNLSEGFSAFLSVIMDLLIRTDLIRKQIGDFNFQPNGIVLIDEPETHLHLSMQYDILPLVSKLFPKIQLIVATHSPAIISSLENSVVFDLTSKSEVSDWILGSSFSELMIRHFGLENEYSPVADKILNEVKVAAKNKDKEALRDILIKNEAFLTPVLCLDIESILIKIKNEQND
jgi:predicted ATP-binding protein involved in virulence